VHWKEGDNGEDFAVGSADASALGLEAGIDCEIEILSRHHTSGLGLTWNTILLITDPHPYKTLNFTFSASFPGSANDSDAAI